MYTLWVDLPAEGINRSPLALSSTVISGRNLEYSDVILPSCCEVSTFSYNEPSPSCLSLRPSVPRYLQKTCGSVSLVAGWKHSRISLYSCNEAATRRR